MASIPRQISRYPGTSGGWTAKTSQSGTGLLTIFMLLASLKIKIFELNAQPWLVWFGLECGVVRTEDGVLWMEIMILLRVLSPPDQVLDSIHKQTQKKYIDFLL